LIGSTILTTWSRISSPMASLAEKSLSLSPSLLVSTLTLAAAAEETTFSASGLPTADCSDTPAASIEVVSIFFLLENSPITLPKGLGVCMLDWVSCSAANSSSSSMVADTASSSRFGSA
jgi:hypothetical protein